jgi:hypothetical protein
MKSNISNDPSAPSLEFHSGGLNVPKLLSASVKVGRMGKIVAASIKRGSYDSEFAKKIAQIYQSLGKDEDAFEEFPLKDFVYY